MQQIQRQMSGFLLQLDANLIEGEPYRLARKNKRRLNVARQNSNISEMWETGLKNPQIGTASVREARSGVIDTQIFSLLLIS